MTTLPTRPDDTEDARAVERLDEIFLRMRSEFRRHGIPSLEDRRAKLGALAGAMFGYRKQIQEALTADFAVHPTQLTDLTETLGVAGQAQYVMEHLAEWAAPEQRFIDSQSFGTATARMQYQPKGTIGVLAPWNFPFLLSLGPLVDILAAGNRAILKPSELAPASAELLAELVAKTFDADDVAVVTGGVAVARHFAGMPWDHLLYTGNAAVGRQVAMAAARNLVPVTLELGGKNPVIVHSDSVNAETVAQILGNKLAKNGQICIAPDYCLVPREQVAAFVDLAKTHIAATNPGYSASSDATGIINERHLGRLVGALDEARRRGVEIVEPEHGAQVDPVTRQMPLTLVIDPPDDLELMTDEIFGPVLPVKPYDTLEDALGYVTSHDRPLGLYVFAADQVVAQDILDRTSSGGACVNTCAIQGVLPSLGFGGSGGSGYGRHRGVEGFREFSNQRGVVVRGDGDAIAAFFPPYSTGPAHYVVSAVFGDAE
ncbi:aldehyde dehydrogenase family protein [Nocardia cyriacigeorgica]|uniref:aldehyde dehydrogenase family protein n=1 Tax=Nocardia cyriacigeorgica TaxID=135487 RepID=UPI0018940EE4|nr:aldehyde dehydrogenase family protein [Nocardia cyriacigeorgica]MBF6098744.1 aldehyde dehydrogenase family protein [Nocardia cyriacigeorgica]MBF6161938.1 aldehyde dehydrogenase family protein [Nocardia cyriacigeorgica]MBF6200736.1 aldehyde dehydrogenase family protein [Nocardia cyriacigeorgica]MBF6317450.1 aldehyde dehydrogenase family protein [Nocardia cyriacigeorgica]MBF6531998.1 aldehyde dehydrogenase family protein [Nocardia cyriacigeorgica]